MARKPRILYSGAIYHVFSRGNYRKDIFNDSGSGDAFVKALLEAAKFSNWWIHSFVVMTNHYHVVIETPDSNLSCGMQWLQGTFANRFNRIRGEHGHVFQGRYKAILIQPGDALRRVVDYVHLNPIRAGLIKLADLRNYRLSSYCHFWQESFYERLVRKEFLRVLNFPNSLEGMREYENWLSCRCREPVSCQRSVEKEIESNLIYGSDEFRENVMERINPNSAFWFGCEEVAGIKWEQIVLEELNVRHRTEEDLLSAPKLAQWKQEISRELRKRTQASNRWIAKRLHMGHASNVSHSMGRIQNPRADPIDFPH